MGAALDDAPVVPHHNGVGIFHRGKAVRNDKHRAARHQSIHAPLHNGLGARINAGGRLIQNHHRRVCHSGPRNGKQLALALRKAGAVARKRNVEKDITFFEGLAETYIAVKPGMFAIFFPQDGHAPGITPDGVKKVIVKVKA